MKLVVKCFPCVFTSSHATLGLNGHAVGKRPRAHHDSKTSAGMCHGAFVACNRSHIYGLVAHTVPLLNSTDLCFRAQEAPKCVPRVRAAEANREPSARRRGEKARS